MKIVRVGHGAGCIHEAESWTIAFAEALSHANVTMNPRSRPSAIKTLMAGKKVTHQDVLFQGEVRDEGSINSRLVVTIAMCVVIFIACMGLAYRLF